MNQIAYNQLYKRGYKLVELGGNPQFYRYGKWEKYVQPHQSIEHYRLITITLRQKDQSDMHGWSVYIPEFNCEGITFIEAIRIGEGLPTKPTDLLSTSKLPSNAIED